MQVLGFKYREDFSFNDFLPEVQSNKFDKLAKIIGTDEVTNNPINDLNYIGDSRFIGYFDSPNSVPTCTDVGLLKPTTVETLAENEKFNDYLVGIVDNAVANNAKVQSTDDNNLNSPNNESLSD